MAAKGEVDADDDLLHAVHRELAEETGITRQGLPCRSLLRGSPPVTSLERQAPYGKFRPSRPNPLNWVALRLTSLRGRFTEVWP